MHGTQEGPSPRPMRWLELSVEVHLEAVEAVSEIFGRLGRGAAVRPTRLVTVPGDELSAGEDRTAPYEVTVHIPKDGEAPVSVSATERALWHLQAFGLGPVGELRVRTVDDGDWANAWRRHYVPQRIGRIVIVPSWLDEPLRAGELAIRLDPGMAFGTGLHPTTRACLTLLQACGPMPPLVIDVGCGSGILGIAALLLGAGRVLAYDIDPVAVRATADNARANDLGERMKVRHGSIEAGTGRREQRAGLICANLVSSVLLDLARPLVGRLTAAGSLICSGVLADRADEVIGAFGAAGARTVSRVEDGDWVSLRLERRG